ncbi:cytochrome c oxidase subunit 2A [Bacillus marinisedimentorum]|nr:cytochrome c oxidase subunit 2A [Bacillus marinisedimentorum]
MNKQTDHDKQAKYEERLKGTFAGVFMIGASILLLWLAAFYLYTDRL